LSFVNLLGQNEITNLEINETGNKIILNKIYKLSEENCQKISTNLPFLNSLKNRDFNDLFFSIPNNKYLNDFNFNYNNNDLNYFLEKHLNKRVSMKHSTQKELKVEGVLIHTNPTIIRGEYQDIIKENDWFYFFEEQVNINTNNLDFELCSLEKKSNENKIDGTNKKVNTIENFKLSYYLDTLSIKSVNNNKFQKKGYKPFFLMNKDNERVKINALLFKGVKILENFTLEEKSFKLIYIPIK